MIESASVNETARGHALVIESGKTESARNPAIESVDPARVKRRNAIVKNANLSRNPRKFLKLKKKSPL